MTRVSLQTRRKLATTQTEETRACLACHQPARTDFCDACRDTALHALLALRDVGPAELGMRVAVLRDWGSPWLANLLVGVVPFDGEG